MKKEKVFRQTTRKNRKKIPMRQLSIVAFLLFVLVVGVMSIQYVRTLRSKAAGATLGFEFIGDKLANNTYLGKPVLDVYQNQQDAGAYIVMTPSGGEQVIAVDLEFQYDPNLVQVNANNQGRVNPDKFNLKTSILQRPRSVRYLGFTDPAKQTKLSGKFSVGNIRIQPKTAFKVNQYTPVSLNFASSRYGVFQEPARMNAFSGQPMFYVRVMAPMR